MRPQPRPQVIIQPAPRPTPVYDANAEFAAANRMLSDYLDAIFSASYISNQAEFNAFKSNTIAQILKNRTVFGPSIYNDLQGNAKQYSLTHIINKTTEYAHARLKQQSRLESYINNNIATEVVEKITAEAQNIIIYEANLNGKLYYYFGAQLQNKVNALVDQKVRALTPVIPQRPPQPTPAPAGPIDYDKGEEDCKVCFEDYDNYQHVRIILACGHSLCKTCIRDMAARNQNNCPKCRRENAIRDAARRLG